MAKDWNDSITYFRCIRVFKHAIKREHYMFPSLKSLVIAHRCEEIIMPNIRIGD